MQFKREKRTRPTSAIAGMHSTQPPTKYIQESIRPENQTQGSTVTDIAKSNIDKIILNQATPLTISIPQEVNQKIRNNQKCKVYQQPSSNLKATRNPKSTSHMEAEATRSRHHFSTGKEPITVRISLIALITNITLPRDKNSITKCRCHSCPKSSSSSQTWAAKSAWGI